MNEEQKYTIQGLEEYIRQGEPQQRERGEAWKVAIGLQQVDGLQTSEYLLDIARNHIEGDITIEEVENPPRVDPAHRLRLTPSAVFVLTHKTEIKLTLSKACF